MVIIGIDAHSRTHSAAAVDEQGRVLAQLTIAADRDGLESLVRWAVGFELPRLVAIENARGYGLAAARQLIAAGEQVASVPPSMTGSGRRQSGQRGKTDRSDAVAIARIALQDPARLGSVDTASLDDELKLLVDARQQLVAEANRWRNRTHALLRVAAPGYYELTGALASPGSVRRAAVVARRARSVDPVRAELALDAIKRLQQLEHDAKAYEERLARLLDRRGATHLRGIRGVGPIVAARILGETRGATRFRHAAAFAAHAGVAPVPASSGRTERHRLNRGGNRQLNLALYTIAMVQARWDPQARTYLDRKLAEGKTAREARRCLKRHLATVVYRALLADEHSPRLT
jgi:transposase